VLPICGFDAALTQNAWGAVLGTQISHRWLADLAGIAAAGLAPFELVLAA
jgi:hypothetical protein